jgi:hypothetical protein
MLEKLKSLGSNCVDFVDKCEDFVFDHPYICGASALLLSIAALAYMEDNDDSDDIGIGGVLYRLSGCAMRGVKVTFVDLMTPIFDPTECPFGNGTLYPNGSCSCGCSAEDRAIMAGWNSF